jgi:hypothetical protein
MVEVAVEDVPVGVALWAARRADQVTLAEVEVLPLEPGEVCALVMWTFESGAMCVLAKGARASVRLD